MNSSRLTGILLAGGRSRRMGRNKAFLKLGDTPLIERVLSRLKEVSREIIMVTSTLEEHAAALAPGRFGSLTVVRDIFPGKGSLGGLYSGLVAASNEYALVVACDMPFLNAGLIRFMHEAAAGNAAVIPRINGRYETLHAVYSRRCIPFIEERLRQDNLTIHDIFGPLRVREITEDTVRRFDPSFLTFFNVNTPADYQAALRIASRSLVASQ